MGLLGDINSSGETGSGRETLILLWTWITLPFYPAASHCWERRGETALNFPFLFVFLSLSWLWKFLVETIFSGKNAPSALCLRAMEEEVLYCSSNSCFSNIPFIFTTNKKTTHREGRLLFLGRKHKKLW